MPDERGHGFIFPKWQMDELKTFSRNPGSNVTWQDWLQEFLHVADFTKLNYAEMGVALYRKCHGEALNVVKSLPVEQREDYDSIMSVLCPQFMLIHSGQLQPHGSRGTMKLSQSLKVRLGSWPILLSQLLRVGMLLSIKRTRW